MAAHDVRRPRDSGGHGGAELLSLRQIEADEEIEIVERYEVTGRVQGVGFRYWTAQTARALGVRGTVRNRADGAVEIAAHGEAEALAEFRARLREGPPGARVEEVRRVHTDDLAEAHGEDFRIIR